jgi:hypothetical protein
LGEALEFRVESFPLSLEVLEVFEFGGQSGLEWAVEFESEFGQPLPVFFRPGGFSFLEDEAVVTKHARDAIFGGFAIDLIGIAQPQEPA